MNNDKIKSIIPLSSQDVEFIFRSYQIYERKFLDVLEIIPLTDENIKSWSPELVDLFLGVSSLLDSISRKIISVDEGKEAKKIDFENLFKTLKLLDSRVVVYVYPSKIIVPYKNYMDTDEWWDIYNSLKHNRIESYKKANLEITLKALAALFLLLVRYKKEEFSKALVRFNLVKTSVVPEIFCSQRMTEQPMFKFWYDSELFGTHESVDYISSDNITSINPAFASTKFHKFIGRFNS